MAQDVRQKLVYFLRKHMHILIWGPAREQKRRLVRSIAASLDLRFRDVTLCPATIDEDLVGEVTPTGEYMSGPFREVFQHGGVLYLDDFEKGPPGLTVALTALIDHPSGTGSFPDGSVKRHPVFFV